MPKCSPGHTGEETKQCLYNKIERYTFPLKIVCVCQDQVRILKYTKNLAHFHNIG